MVKQDTITISLNAALLDAVRKQAQSSYRSISKYIAFILDNAIKAESKGK